MSTVGERIARAIISDVCRRTGMRQLWEELDIEHQREIADCWATYAAREIARPTVQETEAQAAERDVLVVLLSDGALMLFRSDAEYRVLRRIGDPKVPDAFRAHELADEYEFRAEALRQAIEEIR